MFIYDTVPNLCNWDMYNNSYWCERCFKTFFSLQAASIPRLLLGNPIKCSRSTFEPLFLSYVTIATGATFLMKCNQKPMEVSRQGVEWGTPWVHSHIHSLSRDSVNRPKIWNGNMSEGTRPLQLSLDVLVTALWPGSPERHPWQC